MNQAPLSPIVFFDIDNTLLDYGAAETAAAICLYQACSGRLRHSRARFLCEWRRQSEVFFARYVQGELSLQQQRRARIRAAFVPVPAMADAEADDWFALYLAHYEKNWRLFADVLPVLGMLDGFRLGIISNGDSAQQRRKLQTLGIAACFEHVVISGDLGFAKPDQRIFAEAARLAGNRPADCIYVGDHPETDIRAAAQAGFQAFIVDRSASAGPAHACLAGVARLILASRSAGPVP